jgi:hypothetical protein
MFSFLVSKKAVDAAVHERDLAEKDEEIRKLRIKCAYQANWINWAQSRGASKDPKSDAAHLAVLMRRVNRLKFEQPEIHAEFFSKGAK